jgi:hypothetical protein
VWARPAFGRHAGSLVALAYFLETPVRVGGSLAIACVAVLDRLVLPLEGGWRVPVALAFVWTTVALAAAPLRAGKRVPLAGAATQVGLLVASWAVFALVAPVLVYNFLGFELPSAAGDVPASIVRAGGRHVEGPPGPTGTARCPPPPGGSSATCCGGTCTSRATRPR